MMKILVTAFAILAALASPALAQTTSTANMEILRQKVNTESVQTAKIVVRN